MERTINAIKRHIRPAPFEPSETQFPGTEIEKGAVGQVVEAEAGVSGIEAATAVWGKKGRWLVIIGYALFRWALRETPLIIVSV